MAEYICLQPLYNLYDRQKFETEYAQLVEDEKLAVIPYYALASGFLTGKYRNDDDLDKSPRGQSVKKKYFNERGYSILSAMDEVANSLEVPLAQVAIAWLLHHPLITAPIASATSEKQLSELLNSTTVRISADHVKMLTEASAY